MKNKKWQRKKTENLEEDKAVLEKEKFRDRGRMDGRKFRKA